MNKSKPTIKDIAFAAGVSPQTISRVLNNKPDVAPETRRQILKIITDLDFSPNEAARSLVHERNKRTSFTPGKVWTDQDGIPIQAHGGCILYENGIYYWFGENKDTPTKRNHLIGFNVDAVGVSCYTSTDLYNWENKGLVLPAEKDDPRHELHTSKIVERPKVTYNALTQKYVMFLHLDTEDYQFARVGLAVCDQPAGRYEFLGSFAPNQADSRDMTIFKDDDEKAYIFHSSEWNATLYAGELSADYRQTTGIFTKNFEKASREAPAVFKRKGKYYCLSSGCTGWDPNEAQYALADNILGPWKVVGNPCIGPNADKTFFSQSAFVFPVAGQADAYIAMFDLWKKENIGSSRYVWLPIRFEGDQMVIEWLDEWDLSVF
jgi:transcriptional regulator with XRE-family HTH domain